MTKSVSLLNRFALWPNMPDSDWCRSRMGAAREWWSAARLLGVSTLPWRNLANMILRFAWR